MREVACAGLNARRSITDVQPSTPTFNVQPSTSNLQLPTFNFQRSKLNSGNSRERGKWENGGVGSIGEHRRPACRLWRPRQRHRITKEYCLAKKPDWYTLSGKFRLSTTLDVPGGTSATTGEDACAPANPIAHAGLRAATAQPDAHAGRSQSPRRPTTASIPSSLQQERPEPRHGA